MPGEKALMSAVLIVDDSPADRALFRILLNRAGYQVHEVSTGGEALAQAPELRPHMIVLDVNLPDIDGHAVCRGLRADPRCMGIPILMLTVRDHEADILAGLEAGADDYVAKDAASEIILARVRRLVPLPSDGALLGPQRAVGAGRPAAGRHHPRDPGPAVGHPGQRRADADEPRRGGLQQAVGRADHPRLPTAPRSAWST
jgi:CheY-like chemotaxis protein